MNRPGRWLYCRLYGRSTSSAELDRELRTHLELGERERREQGMSAEEARYAAVRELGNKTRIEETVHEMRPIFLIERWSKEVQHALRALGRNPSFTIVALLSLALGIGSNAAIFTVADQMLLRLLPVPHPEQLTLLHWEGRFIGGSTRGWKDSFSLPMYRDLLDAKPDEVAGLAARWQETAVLGWNAGTERSVVEMVSGNYFDVLGVRTVLGRTLTVEDETKQEAEPFVVLSYESWKSKFGADASVLNRKIYLNGYPATIIGVAEPGFAGFDPLTPSDLFIPIETRVASTWNERSRRNSIWLKMIARVRPGVERTAAEAALAVPYVNALQKDLIAHPRDAATAAQYLKNTIQITDATQGLSSRREALATPVYILLAMVGILLLIACVNVANLAIARTARRQREIAIRASLGASRGALIRLVMTETLVLAASGGVLGLLFARWTAGLLIQMLPLERIGLAIHSTPDWRIVAFTAAVSLCAVLISGLTPAIRAARSDSAPVLRRESTTASAGLSQAKLRRVLVTAQVALSLLLLVGAGLFIRSLQKLFAVDTGMKTTRVLSFSIDASHNRYSTDRIHSLSLELQNRIAAIPGVASVSASAVPLLAGVFDQNTILVEGYDAKPGENLQAGFNAVLPGFFSTMAIPLIAGRDFSERDDQNALPVVIVNETFAKRFFASPTAAIGRRAGPPRNLVPAGQPYLFEIVGVVKDSRSVDLKQEPRPWTYVSALRQSGFPTAFYVAVQGEPQKLSELVRGAVRAVDSSLVLYNLKTLERQVSETHYKELLLARLSTALAVLATLLAMVGVYGVTAFAVARRTQEIGIRLAFGATRGKILGAVLKGIFRMTILGIGSGIIASLVVAKPVESQLYGIQPIEPGIIAAAALTIVFVSALAGILPAVRAMRIDPIRALRHE